MLTKIGNVSSYVLVSYFTEILPSFLAETNVRQLADDRLHQGIARCKRTPRIRSVGLAGDRETWVASGERPRKLSSSIFLHPFSFSSMSESAKIYICTFLSSSSLYIYRFFFSNCCVNIGAYSTFIIGTVSLFLASSLFLNFTYS